MSEDVYSYENIEKHRTLRYINIVAPNVVGMLNRISSLMRRKRYNMEEVSVSFDEKGLAHFLIVIQGAECDIMQVMQQIYKLHDVVEVKDVTDQYKNLYYAFYVDVNHLSDLDAFPVAPSHSLDEGGEVKGIFIVNMHKFEEFVRHLFEHRYPYKKRVMSLVA